MMRIARLLFVLLLLSVSSLFGDLLNERIAQMFIAGFDEHEFSEDSAVAKMIRDNKVGGLIFFELIGTRNIRNPEQLKALTTSIKEFAKQHNPSLFLTVDLEGGWVDRFPVHAGFKHRVIMPQSLGNLNDLSFTQNYANHLAEFLQEYGFNLNFSPVLDLNINPVSPAIGGLGRSFSADSAVVVGQAEAFVKAYHEHHIATCLKHFPGHGSANADSHDGLTDITNTWTEKELEPYVSIIKNGGYSDCVMIAHVINKNIDSTVMVTKNGGSSPVPATFSKKIIQEKLRGDLGFKGVVMSDDMTMGAIANLYDLRSALKNGINAGVDMFILANHKGRNDTEVAIQLVREMVDSGEISLGRIHESCSRIQMLKKRFIY